MASTLTAPRGTQDILPPQSVRWSVLEARAREIAGRFGYAEIRTPMFESTELFIRGVGETTDIVEKEMYTFIDKGERSMTLRPEWTAPVVRAALEHKLFADGARRFFYIGPIFRYERPQKGRYRQAHQFGVECFGFSAPEADAEVIALAWELVRSHGIDDAVLNLNTIGDVHCRPRFRDALLQHFRPHLSELSADSQRRLERNPMRILDSKDAADTPFITSAPTLMSLLCDDCRMHFEAVKCALTSAGIPFVVNERIVRGLDYYSRTVFEITSSLLGAQSTVCGGGRYDELVHSLGGPPMPAVGFGLGLERFLMMLDALGEPVAESRCGIQAIALGAVARAHMFSIVSDLRACTQDPVFMDFGERKILAHLKVADRNAARFALILGSEELTSQEIVLRDLQTRQERRLPLGSGKELCAAIAELE